MRSRTRYCVLMAVLAVLAPIAVSAETLFALIAPRSLVRFDSAAPGAILGGALITGLAGASGILRSQDTSLFLVAWGSPVLNDFPAFADYDGDGLADVAVYRRTTGEWFIRRSVDGSLLLLPFGAPVLNDAPVPADYDGDGKVDVAVYRQDTGQWFILRSTDATLMQVDWGAPALGDLPLPVRR